MVDDSQSGDGAETEIETWVEKPTRGTADYDVEACVADEAYNMMKWQVARLDATTVAVRRVPFVAGVRKNMDTPHVGDDRETFDVDEDKSTEQWAREHANADPEAAIELVRDQS